MKLIPLVFWCVSSWVFRFAGVFAGCTFLCTSELKFSPSFCRFHLFASAEPLPWHLLPPRSPLCTFCRFGYALAFMVSSFPSNKSHAPVPLVSPSQRCCGMSHRALWERRGAAPSLALQHGFFCWFPFFLELKFTDAFLLP